MQVKKAAQILYLHILLWDKKKWCCLTSKTGNWILCLQAPAFKLGWYTLDLPPHGCVPPCLSRNINNTSPQEIPSNYSVDPWVLWMLVPEDRQVTSKNVSGSHCCYCRFIKKIYVICKMFINLQTCASHFILHILNSIIIFPTWRSLSHQVTMEPLNQTVSCGVGDLAA